MTKQINTTNKNNGGKSIMRVWEFGKQNGMKAKETLSWLSTKGINKHHWFCGLTQEELCKLNNKEEVTMNQQARTINKVVEIAAHNMKKPYEQVVAEFESTGIDVNANIITQDELSAVVADIKLNATTKSNNKRYFIHTERNDKDSHKNSNAMPFYEDMATICGMRDKKVYFGFGEAVVDCQTSYFDVCAQSYNACREGGTVYLFEYDAPATGDVNVHNFNDWIEYLHEVQSMSCNKEEAFGWAKLIAENNGEINHVGDINEVVFHKDSNVRLVAKMECKNEEQCRFVYNYIAAKYGLAISCETIPTEATIGDFSLKELKHIYKYFQIIGTGELVSKKTNYILTKDQVPMVKDWVERHAI